MKERGFTLVELAIVLVIIGIIIGAILKGTELINNAKAKRLQNDLRGVEAAMWTFFDRMGRFPGDCNNDGVIDFGGLPVTAILSFTYDSNPSPGDCSSPSNIDKPWFDLRVQRILPTNTPNTVVAKHTFSQFFAIGHYYNGTYNFNAIAAYGIPAWAAKMIDTSIDGTANGTIGKVRRLDGASGSTFPAWPDDNANDQVVALVYFLDKTP